MKMETDLRKLNANGNFNQWIHTEETQDLQIPLLQVDCKSQMEGQCQFMIPGYDESFKETSHISNNTDEEKLIDERRVSEF